MSQNWYPQYGKRILDLVLATGLTILTGPVMLLVALLVRLKLGAPVLFRQQRPGWHGRPFTIFKFRTMTDRCDENGHLLPDEQRLTRFGRFLRSTSLDELPELINVLKGDMSLVGPRPCLPYEWELYEDWQRHRLDVMPGITGLWQVSGRSQVPFEEMVLLDLHYIANWSLGLDLALLARTVPVVIHGSGGH